MTLFLVLLAPTHLACSGVSKLPTNPLTIAGHRVTAEVAFTYTTRQEGLMNRSSMGADHGMLFIYKEEQVRRFWMKDTRIPLSIAFANRRGEIVRIEDMTPFDTDGTSSFLPATYALEMNKGWFAAHGIEKGAVIEGIPTDVAVE